MTGYDVVGEQIKEYWKIHHICDVVVLILVDGSEVETIAFVNLIQIQSMSPSWMTSGKVKRM